MTATSDVKPFTGTGTIINPATGAPAGQVRWTDPADVADGGAAGGQREWEARGAAGRAKVLARYAVWLGKHRAEIEELLIKETGKSATDAAQEVPLILMITSYYIRTMEKALAPDKRPAALPFLSIKKIEVHYRPRSVVGIIRAGTGPGGQRADGCHRRARRGLRGAAQTVRAHAADRRTADARLAGLRRTGRPRAGPGRARGVRGRHRRQRLHPVHRVQCHGREGGRAGRAPAHPGEL